MSISVTAHAINIVMVQL